METRNNSPLKWYRLPQHEKPVKTQTVLYYDEEAEKLLIAKYEKMRAEILRQIQMNQQSKTKVLAEIDARIEALMRNFTKMTQEKIQQLKEID